MYKRQLRKDVKPKLYHLLLLAKNNEGYHNLLKLVSESHVDNFYYKPRTTFSMLQKYGHGIIGSSACIAGVIPKLLDERRFDDAVEWARKFASCFDEGDFYICLLYTSRRPPGLFRRPGRLPSGRRAHPLHRLLLHSDLEDLGAIAVGFSGAIDVVFFSENCVC